MAAISLSDIPAMSPVPDPIDIPPTSPEPISICVWAYRMPPYHAPAPTAITNTRVITFRWFFDFMTVRS